MAVEFLSCLLVGSRDAVGTVREAAYKSLSDLVLVVGSGLALESIAPTLPREACVVGGELLESMRLGCLDSKLTTRTNAVGALSSFLLVTYPAWSQ
jgi:hypothetical protein